MQEIRFHGRGGQGTVVASILMAKAFFKAGYYVQTFPADHIRRLLGPAQKAAVIDRNFSFGASGIFAQEIRAALCNLNPHPPVYGYIAGLGGRDITPQVLEDIYWSTKNDTAPQDDSSWIGLNRELMESWQK